mmetsp:Transcript_29872/g.92453  ORF Transcript_29872/g.92453 Transcript_29872/m.92453 type:complete len:195 (-) Transcript_29872:41-625(-)
MAGLRFLATLGTLQLAAGHPTFARKGQSAAAEHATHWKGPSTTTEQAVRSYHFHVQFVAGNKNSTAKALRLRSAYVERWGNESCAGLFEQDGLCMYNVDFAAMGPFVSGNWAAYVPTARYQEVLAWITQRRGDLSIIAHPNSRNVVHDHFRFATWVGRPWPLNVEPLLWSKGLLPLESCNEWECIIGRSGGWGV